MAPYRIVTDATADCSGEWLAALPSFDVIPMQVEIGGQNHAYGPGGELSAEQFYELQKAGSFASTSQTVELNFLWLLIMGFNYFRYIPLTL